MHHSPVWPSLSRDCCRHHRLFVLRHPHFQLVFSSFSPWKSDYEPRLAARVQLLIVRLAPDRALLQPKQVPILSAPSVLS